MAIPQDPYILLSFINMKLRDGDYESLDALCDSLGCKKEEVVETLHNAGFEYIESANQFR